MSKIIELNQLIAASERLIRSRGTTRDIDGGQAAVFSDESWWIVAGHRARDGWRGLSVTFRDREVFRVAWPEPDDPGRVLMNEPGGWKAALLDLPSYSA